MNKPNTSGIKIAVVIPAFKVADHILDVVKSIGQEVDHIIVVDDACPYQSGGLVKRFFNGYNRIEVIHHEFNLGVGGGMITGYRRALELNADIIVKVDGDGQMDTTKIHKLIKPILNGDADYTKGNRFFDIETLSNMPKIRVFGNLILSFFAKISSGYWNVFDPNNGFTAITSSMLKTLPLEKLEKRFFFESDMLFRLYLSRARVIDVPIKSIYKDEVSNLKIGKATLDFSKKHLRNFIKRIFYTYYLRDFTVASVELPIGLLFFFFSSWLGIKSWIHSHLSGIPTQTGTQVLVAISFLAGMQLLISFIDFDTDNFPK